MSSNDSSTLIDSPAAGKLGENRALFYSEEENRIEKFRPYGLPEAEWLDKVKARFASRPVPEAPVSGQRRRRHRRRPHPRRSRPSPSRSPTATARRPTVTATATAIWAATAPTGWSNRTPRPRRTSRATRRSSDVAHRTCRSGSPVDSGAGRLTPPRKLARNGRVPGVNEPSRREVRRRRQNPHDPHGGGVPCTARGKSSEFSSLDPAETCDEKEPESIGGVGVFLQS